MLTKNLNDKNIELFLNKDFKGLLTANARYILKVANNLQQSDYLEDLVQAGNIGLFLAYQNFAINKDIPFMQYAKFWIKGEMLKFLATHGRTIRLPANILKELKNGTHILTTNTISLNTPINDDDNQHTLNDVIASPPVESEKEDYSELFRCLNKLNPRYQKIITMRYGLDGNDPLSLEEIGNTIGVTRQAVSIQLQTAVNKLKSITKNYYS